MEHARYLRAQAKHCYAIARKCRDLGAASEINAVGNALRKKAVELMKTARRRRAVAVSGTATGLRRARAAHQSA
jgi:hypothetical protein